MLQYKILIIIFIVSVSNFLPLLKAGAASAEADKQDDNVIVPGKRVNKLLSLLDWNTYMRFFNKRYSSLTQQLVRQKIFLHRIMEVFVTGTKYRLYQLSYYTAINKWSDATPSESDQLLLSDLTSDEQMTDEEQARKVLLETIASNRNSAFSTTIEDELRRERAEALIRGKVKSRRKRDANEVIEKSRELSVADMILVDKETSIDPNIKIKWVVSPDNPDYEPPVKSALVTTQAEVIDIPASDMAEIESDNKYNISPTTLMKSAFNEAINWWSSDKKDSEEKSNTIVIRDWRKSGCIGPPRDQGYCASCYAMSSMGFVEWALCANQGNILTPLSVQYMVSCGLQLRDETSGQVKLEGCRHGMSRHTMDFVREYGVELDVNMPYFERETVCPIAPETPRKKKGYIRPNVKNPLRLSSTTQQLDLALKAGPVIVSMREPKNFLAYGGGLVEHCDQRGGHAMLVVGNMIEDGVEYLLIKNSFGSYWGYDGYFKFRRSAMKECVKEFIVPMVSFPGRKAQNRHVKAYLANQQDEEAEGDGDVEHFDLNHHDSHVKELFQGDT